MIYEDRDGVRIIIREEGPPGIGIPTGGNPGQIVLKRGYSDYDVVWGDPLDAIAGVNGPIVSTTNSIALWDGTTGNLLKDSGVLISTLATQNDLLTKVDKAPGFALSQNSFTNAYKAQLDALGNQDSFRGNYASLVALQIAVPLGNAGDYAYVLVSGQPAVQYIWDSINSAWVEGAVSQETGATIAAKLFAEPDTNNFTDYYRDTVTTSVQQTTFDATVTDFQNQINAFGVGGAVSLITQSSMTALGFTHQQARVIGGVTYYVPMKSTAWP